MRGRSRNRQIAAEPSRHGQYADHHRLRRGGRGGIVPGLGPGFREPAAHPEGNVDFAQDFFGREAFLTVSGQLNVEAYCLALTKVYTFGPTFRAENSNTSRHLAEFWMIEPEIAFADLSDNAALAEALLKYTFAALLNERQEDLAFFDQRIEKGLVAKLEGIVGSEFVHMDYGEAIQVLERANEKFEFPVNWGVDLQSEHERYLTEKYAKKPVIVMNYPKAIKAFYMRVNDDGRTVAAMDVLAPGIGEIIGGSQREERLDVLDRNMAERGIDREHYAWYRDLRRYGTVPHAGFGLGFERTLAYVTGLANVRDAIPFPRTPGNATVLMPATFVGRADGRQSCRRLGVADVFNRTISPADDRDAMPRRPQEFAHQSSVFQDP